MTRKKKGKVKHQAPKGSAIPTKTLGASPEDALEPLDDASSDDASSDDASSDDVSSDDASSDDASSDDASSDDASSDDEAERKPFRVSCNAPNLKVNSGDYLATDVEDAKAQFFKAAGILSTKHPVKVKPGEDLSDVFGDV